MTHITQLAAEAVDLLALHAANPQRYPYLLESLAHQGDEQGWDVLFAFPGETLSAAEGEEYIPPLLISLMGQTL